MNTIPLSRVVTFWVVGLLVAVSSGVAAEPKEVPLFGPELTVRGITPSATYKDVFDSGKLMAGGQLVADPLDDRVHYYVSPDWASWKRENFGKPTGLLVSFDQGKTWRVLSRAFVFKSIFVHPIDGRLYAVISYEWQKTGDDGFLRRQYADKVVVSEDGHRWKDITRGPGYVATLLEIFQDPDHPKRVCVRGNIIRAIVFQYTDDEYSDWTLIRERDWEDAHPSAEQKAANRERVLIAVPAAQEAPSD